MSESAPETIQPALLTIPQVCEYLNFSRPLLYKLAASGKLGPLPMKLCHKVLYRRDEIERWVQSGCPHRKQWQIQKKEIKP